MRPALQLRPHEAEGVRLDRVTHGVRHEAHLVPRLIQAPREIHVFGERAIRPAALRPQNGRPVHREAAGGDQRLPVILLHALVVGECEQVLHIAPTLPHAADALGQHEAARGRDAALGEGREQPLDRVRREHRVRVDGDGEWGADVAEGERLRPRFGARVRRWAHDDDPQRPGDVAGPVGGAVVHDDDFTRSRRLRLEAPDRVRHTGRLVEGGHDDRYIRATKEGKH